MHPIFFTMNDTVTLIVHFLQTFPNELIEILTYLSAHVALFILHRSFGKDGLFAFIILAIFVANVQTLKAITLVGFSSPVPMGTILIAMSFLATDIVAELYGRKEAEKAIWLSLSVTLLMSVFMILTLGTKAASTPNRYLEAHQAIEFIFTPSTAIFIASITAYLVSQYSDVALFLWLKKLTQGRLLGFRTVVAMLTSTLLDNTIFSILAWKVFYPLPIEFPAFFATYILGTFVLRILVTLANAPVMYLFRHQTKNYPHVAYVS